MNTNDLFPGYTFIGFIPTNSPKEHLGIVLLNDNLSINYCYCTSKDKLIKYHNDYVEISSTIMEMYFSQKNKKTYIFIGPAFIKSILLFTFINYLKIGEYEAMRPFPREKLLEIFNKIINNKSFSKAFKDDLRAYFGDLTNVIP
jgi:hypothetical protein